MDKDIILDKYTLSEKNEITDYTSLNEVYEKHNEWGAKVIRKKNIVIVVYENGIIPHILVYRTLKNTK